MKKDLQTLRSVSEKTRGASENSPVPVYYAPETGAYYTDADAPAGARWIFDAESYAEPDFIADVAASIMADIAAGLF